MRRRGITLVLLLAASLGTSQPGADQADPRLPILFGRLHAAAPAQAHSVEQAIWAIWLETPDSEVNALMSRALGHMGEGELEQAIAVLGAVVERAPGFAEGWNKRAIAHFLNEDYAASVSDIHKTLDLEPRHFGAISGLGLIFMRRNDLPSALKAFERVLEIYPHAQGARSHVELIRRHLGERSV